MGYLFQGHVFLMKLHLKSEYWDTKRAGTHLKPFVNKSTAGMHDTPPHKFNLAKMFVNKFSI